MSDEAVCAGCGHVLSQCECGGLEPPDALGFSVNVVLLWERFKSLWR